MIRFWIFNILLIAASSLNAQPKTGWIFHFGSGTSTKSKVVVELGGGYQYKNAMVEGYLISTPLDLNVDHASYFGSNAGYEIAINENWSITPLAGASYRMQSTDKKQLNGFAASIGARLKWKVAYAGAQMSGRTKFFTVGLGGVLGE